MEVRKRLEDLMNTYGLSKQQTANLVGISRLRMSKYINQDGYRNSLATAEADISQYFSNLDAKAEKSRMIQQNITKPGFDTSCKKGDEQPQGSNKLGFGTGNSKNSPASENNILAGQLKMLMKKQGKSMNKTAKALAISAAALSQWLKEEYTGDIEKINETVRAYLKREEKVAINPRKKIEFVTTFGAERAMDVASICHTEREIGVVYGEAGLGKTTAAKEYVKRNPGTILIEATPMLRPHHLLKRISKVLACTVKNRNDDMFWEIVDQIKDTGRLIVIDEAENLAHESLEYIRRLHDIAGMGLLLVGLPRLIANLRGGRSQHAQLYSRVSIAIKIETLDLEDCEEIVRQMIPDASKSLVKCYQKACLGNARTLSKLLPRSINVAINNKIDLDEDVIEETARILIKK